STLSPLIGPIGRNSRERFCLYSSSYPVCVIGYQVDSGSSELRLTAGEVKQFLRDIALTLFVEFERQVLDQVVGVVCGILHRHHAGALLARLGIQQNPVKINVEVVRQEKVQNGLRARLKDEFGGMRCPLLFGFRSLDFKPLDWANG